MENNLELYDRVRITPPEALKKINGGRLNGMSDINPMWRIKVLTEVFGPCGFGWYYEIAEKELIPASNGEVKCFVTIRLFVKMDDGVSEEWSRPIIGTGGSSFAVNESKGLYVNDECYKMALTDAIGVACKALGVGADVYFEKDKTKYQTPQNTPSPAPGPDAVKAKQRKDVETYIANNDEYRKQVYMHYGYGSFEEFTEKDIASIYSNLVKNNRI